MKKESFSSFFIFKVGMGSSFTVHDTSSTVIVAKIYCL